MPGTPRRAEEPLEEPTPPHTQNEFPDAGVARTNTAPTEAAPAQQIDSCIQWLCSPASRLALYASDDLHRTFLHGFNRHTKSPRERRVVCPVWLFPELVETFNVDLSIKHHQWIFSIKNEHSNLYRTVEGRNFSKSERALLLPGMRWWPGSLQANSVMLYAFELMPFFHTGIERYALLLPRHESGVQLEYLWQHLLHTWVGAIKAIKANQLGAWQNPARELNLVPWASYDTFRDMPIVLWIKPSKVCSKGSN